MADNTSQIAGLFMTPELYQQQRNALAQQNAVQMAQLTPLQRASAGLRYGGYQLGNALAGALGSEDPALQIQGVRNKLAGQFDTSSAEGLIGLSQALRSAGDLQGAALVAQQALAAREKEATIQAKLAERLTPQQKNAAAMADSAGLARGTPEWQAEYNKNLSDLANPEKLTTDQRNYDAAVKGGYKGTFQEWMDRQKLLGRNVTNINMPAGESEFVKELGKLDAKTVSESFKTRESAIEELRTLQKMAELNQKPLISGSNAQIRSDVANFFDTIGISSNKDTMKTSNSQEYTKYASGLVLDKIKKLGTNPSNADREFANRIVPQLENSAQARTELIQYLTKRANEVISETNRMEQYARKNRGLSGYEPTVPLVSTTSGAKGMTTEQLKAIAGIK